MNPGAALHVAGFGPLTVVLVALVATVGALLIHFALRGRNAAGPSPESRPVPSRVGIPAPTLLPVRDPSLPEWSRADDPLLDDDALRHRMLEIAGILVIHERVLPRIERPDGREGDFLFRDEDAYVYTSLERGSAMFEDRSLIADQVLYWVFRDRSFMHAYLGMVGQNLPHEEQSRRAAQASGEMMARYDPRWQRQLEHDRGASGAAGSAPL